MKNWLIVSGLVAGVALAAVAYAEGPGRACDGRRMGGEHGGGALQAMLDNPDMAKQFGITDEQITAIHDATYEHQKSMIKLQGDAELAKLEVKKLLDQDAPDTAAVMKAVENAGKAETDIRKEAIQNMLKIRGIVGADTMKKVREQMRESFAAHHDGEHHGWKRGGSDHNGNGGPGGPRADDQAPPADDGVAQVDGN